MTDAATDLIALLVARRLTVATCESLTGGLVSAALTAVPGSSAVVLGGLVTYATRLKTQLASVEERLIAAEGVVSEAVAEAMAVGVRTSLGADLGLACTGVAGPGEQDGVAPGTVWIAVAHATGVLTQELHLAGGRDAVREGTVTALLALTRRCLQPDT